MKGKSVTEQFLFAFEERLAGNLPVPVPVPVAVAVSMAVAVAVFVSAFVSVCVCVCVCVFVRVCVKNAAQGAVLLREVFHFLLSQTHIPPTSPAAQPP